jgi:hypothetical protein
MSEERATTIFDAENTKLLAAAREVDAAIGGLGGTAKKASDAAVAGSARMAGAAAKASTAVQKVNGNFAATSQAARTAADQIQGVIGKVSGYLGAAGLVVTAVVGISAAVYDWATAQEEVNKKLDESHSKIVRQAEIFAALMEMEERHRVADRQYAAEKAGRDAAYLSYELEANAHDVAMAEIAQADEQAINELKLAGLQIQLDEAVATNKQTQAIENQIEQLQLKNDMLAGANETSSRSVGGGPSRAPKIASNADPKFEDLSDQLATREQAVNARRLSAIEAERAAMAEVEAFRFESEITLLGVNEGNGARIHELNMSAIEAERAAADAALEARENALRSDGTGDALDRLQREDELKQVVHERDMNRLEADLSMRQAVAEESKRIAEEQKAELERQLSTISEVTSAVESVASNLAGKLGEFASMRMEQEAAELEQYTAGLEARGQQQSAALDREIAQARGNAARLAKLQEQKRKLEESTGKAIEKAKADHAAKADKIERIQKGTSMLLTGAQEVVETAAAYPNPVSMAAHAVAAALAFGFGAAVLAGGTPGAGGGGGAASMGGGSGSGSSNVEFGEAAKTPGSLGTSAGTAPKLAQTSSANGSTVFNGPVTFNSNGSIDRAAAESIALESGKAARSREGAGRT